MKILINFNVFIEKAPGLKKLHRVKKKNKRNLNEVFQQQHNLHSDKYRCKFTI